jgi:hypothetical protein
VRTTYEAVGAERTDVYYAIAGYVVQLSFAGKALLRLMTPALAHRQLPARSAPDLHVCLWDTVETAVPLPQRPWEWRDHIARSDVSSLTSERFQTAYNWPQRHLDILDQARNLAFSCTYNAAKSPADYAGSPLLNILHWWMRSRGLQYIHAGAVGFPDKGVLLAGAGGSGKSTTALACLQSDLVYVGDDYCLIGSAPQPYAHNLYSSAKVHRDNLHRLPHVRSAVSNADSPASEKALLCLQPHFPHKVVPGLPIRAVFLPRPTGRVETCLVPASRMEAFKAIMVSTMMQLAGSNDHDVKALSHFIRQVPCYHLEAGTDLDGLTGTIRKFLSAV